MGIGYEAVASDISKVLVGKFNSTINQAQLIFGDEFEVEDIVETTATRLGITNVARIELGHYSRMDDPRQELMQQIGQIVRSSDGGILHLAGLETASRYVAIIVGTVCGDRQISDRGIESEELPKGWGILITGDRTGCENNGFVHNSWLLDRFGLYLVKSPTDG